MGHKIPGLFFTFGFLVLVSYSQTDWLIAKRYSTESGLTNDQIFSITQDQQGFLWMATADGVSRFDGYSFRNYYSDPNDSSTLAVSFIKKVMVDRFNNVWISGTRSTLQRYDRTRDCFIRYDRTLKKLLKTGDFSVGLDVKNNLVVLGGRGMAIYDERQDYFHIRAFYMDNSGIIPAVDNSSLKLVCLDDAIYLSPVTGPDRTTLCLRFNIDSMSYPVSRLVLTSSYRINYPEIRQKNDLNNHSPDDQVYRSSDGNLWMTCNTGVFLLDSVNRVFNPYTGSLESIKFLTRDNYIIWNTPGKGISVFEQDTRITQQIPETGSYLLTNTFLDNQENLWVSGRMAGSTGNTGLIKAIRCRNQFESFNIPVESRNNEPWAVFAIIRDASKNLWIGINNLPYILKVKPDNRFEKIMVVPEKLRSTGFSPRVMYFDDHGFLWIGFLHNLLVKMDTATKITEQVYDKPVFRNQLAYMKSFRRIKPAGPGKIWLGGSYGFCRTDIATEKVDYAVKLDDPAFYDFYFGEKNDIWVANKGTLKYYQNGKWIKDFPLFDSNYDISMIIPGEGNIFWLPLFGGGLCRFDKNDHTYHAYTKEDGLANNAVYCGLKDDKGNLWLSSNKGISRFNMQTGQFWNFDRYDGIRIEEFNGNSCCLADDGEMIFGGMGGYIRFYPDSIQLKQQTGNNATLIYEVRSVGVPISFDSAVYLKKKIILEKGRSNVTFYFTCTDLRNADKISFRYRLNGHDESWNMTDNRTRIANYVNLVPGIYNFHLEASDMNNEWSRSTDLAVIIPPKFYQRSEFKLLMVLLVVSVLVAALWLYIRRIKLDERKKKEMIRLESLRSQLNPHFIFNALNPLNYLISTRDVMAANQYLSNFSRLLRLFLTNSRSEFIHIGQEVETLQKYLIIEQARYGKIFLYDIQVSPVLLQTMPELAPSMVQPFLENSIIHGFNQKSVDNPGHLLVQFDALDQNFIQCIIEDDGVGIKASQKRNEQARSDHVSQGLQIIKERLELYNSRYYSRKKIEFSDINPGAPEPGTRVTIPIPFRNNKLNTK